MGLSGARAKDIAEAPALVHECRQGSQAAWRALFDAHFDFVQRVARRLGTPDAEVDDVCQEAFWVAFRKLEQFSHGRFSTWLYRITANIVSDRHRRRRFRERLAQLVGRAEPPPTPSGADRRLEQQEAAAMVNRVLAAMSPKRREVLALFELEGLSGPEIAERVGCKVETVWVHLHKARKDFARIARKKGWRPEGGP